MSIVALQKTKVTAIDGSVRLLNPQEYADEVVRQSNSSFYWPMMLMDADRRAAIMAVYAFCKLVDDEADNNINKAAALKKLDFFQRQIEIIYDRESTLLPTHPVTKALSYHVRRFDMPEQPFISIIDGCRMDVNGEMVNPGLEKLDNYCQRVASSVGLLAIEIFGYKNSSAKRFAVNLGKFMQLVNIIRDVREDAKKDRIYLPRESLAQYGLNGITPQRILQNPYSFELCRVYEELGRMARKYLHRANVKLAPEDRHSMRPALFMRDIYLRYLDILESANWYADENNLELSLMEKVKIFGRLLSNNDNLI